MSAPVDVLAVLDTLCERAASGDPAEYREVNSLRYAVSELMEAAQRLRDRAEFESFGRDASAELEAVSAALARVKGGAA